MNQLKYSWFLKYKLHHLPFWFAYHFMWWTLRIGSPVAVLESLALPHAAFKFFFYMVFQAAGVYFNLYFLMPRFLERGRYAQYIALLLLTIIITAVFIVSGYYVGAWVLDKPFAELYHKDPAEYFSLFESGALPSTAASMTLAMSIKLTRNWIHSRRRAQVLEKEKLETELKFLRAQFNPHFLFNTINSIFVLIHKNPIMASESLAKFSELLRYQLYECNEHHIPLTQELAYLDNFIVLQKLRQDGNVLTTVYIDHPENADLSIAPFLIMPFVENAFKHVSQHKNGDNWITLRIYFVDRQLHMDVGNSTASSHANEALIYKGIGLKNVQRRLDLLYPDQHTLTVTHTNDVYRVNLILNLNEKKKLELNTTKVA